MKTLFTAVLMLSISGASILHAQWFQYPSYQEYVQLLENWQRDYPDLCKVYKLGETERNHEIFAVKISDNVTVKEPEPKYLQTSMIHYDETSNYMLTLHMIDTLLTCHGTDDRITDLVNYAELWFATLLNPDLTYHGTDARVSPPPRNPMTYDINRNWPCACMVGNHPYYGAYSTLKPLTAIIMNIHKLSRFNLCNDMHGGAEAVLYPYASVREPLCDNDWYEWSAKRYVGQVRGDCGNNIYMTSCGGAGMGHCYTDFYECHGTRLDFCACFVHAKSFWMETSNRKNLPESRLQDMWEWNREALFQFYELLYTGIQGVVTDASTKKPVCNVNITADDHDVDSSNVYTDTTGFYLRFINRGTYSLTFSHPGYLTKTIDSVRINDYTEKVELNVELEPQNMIKSKFTANTEAQFSIVPVNKGIKILFHKKRYKNLKVAIYSVTGKKIRSLFSEFSDHISWDGLDSNGRAVSRGCYIICLENKQYKVLMR